MAIDRARTRGLLAGGRLSRSVGAKRTLLLALAMLFGAPAAASAASLPQGGAGARPAGGRKSPRSPTVVLFHVNRRETLKLRLFDERGRPLPGLGRRLTQFFRCHHTNKRHIINPRLVRLIYETGRHYRDRRIEVISGFRDPRVAKNPRSPHMKGLACDMRVAGVKNAELRDFFRRRFKNVGVGYYPNSSFVHLDVRRGASAFWIDYSGPGQTALYSDDPVFDLMTGRAEGWKHTTIDPQWAEFEDPDDDGGELAADEVP
jgi:uncharacterized protein YcbK (DUF882 family)